MDDNLLKILDEAVKDGLHKNIYDIDENTNLFNIGLDSIGFINIIVALENAYDIFIDEDDLETEKFSTIKNIKEYIEKIQCND